MECPVCLDAFSNPVVLPCGHTLCRDTCAKGLIRDDCLKCPSCRTDHWVPDGLQSLPRNYSLQELLEQPGEGQPGEGTTDISPLCADHTDVSVSMLCVQCCQPVCLRCYLCTPEGEPPKHLRHEIIPKGNVSEYLQSMSACVTEYLQSHRHWELSRFESLTNARVNEQEWVACSDLPDQRETVLQRLFQFDSLENQWKALLATEENDTDVWQKCENLKRLLQRLDDLPSSNGQPTFHQVLSARQSALNRDPLTLELEPPAPPQFSLEDCVFGDSSAAIAWLFSPEDHVTYFTVYYVTAIFAGGMCNDCQSFDVTDFGQSKAQTTIRGLHGRHRYRLHVVARNNAGASQRSHFLYFKPCSGDSDVKII